MPKFHDEFFRRGSPSHDELVATTIEKIDAIIGRMNGVVKQLYFENKGVGPDENAEICLCSSTPKPPWCSRSNRTAFRNEPVCIRATRDYPELDDSKEKYKLPNASDREFCNYVGWKTIDEARTQLIETCKDKESKEKIFDWGFMIIKDRYPESKYIHLVQPNYKIVKCPLTHTLESYECHRETEKICSTGKDFIIGYADIVFDLQFKIRTDARIEEDWIWEGFDRDDAGLRMIVECKPELDEWGGPLRQIKTYMSTLGSHLREQTSQTRLPTIGLLTTYTRFPDRFRKILEQENVYVITFSKDGSILTTLES